MSEGITRRSSIAGNEIVAGVNVEIINGVATNTVTVGEHVVLVGNVATNTITMGPDVELDEDDVAQYTGVTPVWHWINLSDVTATVEGTSIISATQDTDTKYITASLRNTTMFPDDYPSRMPGYVLTCKKTDGTALSMPVAEGKILRVYVQIDPTSLPTANALANVYLGLCNTAGVPSTSTSGLFVGWRRSGTGTYVLATTKGTETAALSTAARYVVSGTMVFSTYMPVMISGQILNTDGSWSNFVGTQGSSLVTPANTDFRLFLAMGLASSNDNPVGPHTLKFRAAYSWVESPAYPY